uniref:EamA domain-containing protein n=1 Tax=viral metagenome TaxID=1070528 RepID=A0A6C0I375_9ZZZZ
MKLVILLTALFIAVLEGLAPIIHKHLLAQISPATLLVVGALAYFFCVFCFALYHKETLITEIPTISKRDWLIILGSTAITGFVVNILYYTILQNHESFVIAALIFCSPVFTMLILFLFMNHKLNGFSVLGVLSIVLGVICIAFSEAEDKEENFLP